MFNRPPIPLPGGRGFRDPPYRPSLKLKTQLIPKHLSIDANFTKGRGTTKTLNYSYRAETSNKLDLVPKFLNKISATIKH